MEGILQEVDVAVAAYGLLDGIDAQRGPGMDGWIDVAEVPFVGGHLTVGVQIAFIEHERQLLLGEVEIDHGQGHGMEGQVPGRIPGILPLIRHGDDVAIDHMKPLLVADR